MLAKLGLAHALIIFSDGDEVFFRAARNLAGHKLLPLAGLNVYDILNYDELLMTTKTARAIEARLRVDSNSNSNSDSAGDAR
jgi:large subunit ribosomal protein L4